MTEPELSWNDARVGVRADGAVSLSVDGTVYLTGWGPASLIIGDTEVALGPARSTVLADEVQLDWRPLPGVELTVRHGFGSVWAQRVMVRLDRRPPGGDQIAVAWRLAAGPRTVAWVAPVGAAGTIALLARRPGRPVLGLRVASGALNGDPARPVTGPVARRSDGPVVVADLVGECYPDAARFADTLRHGVRTGWLPATVDLSAGEPLVLQHPDGVLSEGGAALATDADGTWLVDPPGTGAGRRLLALDDAGGRTALELSWAPPVAELVRRTAVAILAGPTTGQGTALLPDGSAAAIVGWALSAGGLEPEPAERAEEALERWLADPRGTPDVWQLLTAVQEYQRVGELGLLMLAEQQLRDLTVPERSGPVPAGLGLVGTQVVLALMASGRNARPALDGLRGIAGPPGDALGRAELALVLGTRFGGGPEHRWSDDLVQGTWEAVALLGAGLRGGPATDAGWVVRARAATLCALLPGVGDPFLHRTAQSVGTLARSAGNRLLADLSDAVDAGPVGEDARAALLWIGLAGPDLVG